MKYNMKTNMIEGTPTEIKSFLGKHARMIRVSTKPSMVSTKRPTRYHKRWTAEEDKLVAQSYGKVPTRRIAKQLSRNTDAVKFRAYKLHQASLTGVAHVTSQ